MIINLSGIDFSGNGGGGGGGSYVLPVASPTRLGGIKVGSGLTIDSGGTLSSEGGSAAPQDFYIDWAELHSMGNQERMELFSELVEKFDGGWHIYALSVGSGATDPIYVLPLTELISGTYEEGYGYAGGYAKFGAIHESGSTSGYMRASFGSEGNLSPNQDHIGVYNFTPTASATRLGGIKVGSGLTISNGVLSVEGGGGVPVVESLENLEPEPGAVVELVGDKRNAYFYNGIDSDPYSVTLTDGDSVDYTFTMDGQDSSRWYTYHEETNDWYIHYMWLGTDWDDDGGRIVAGFLFYTTDGEGQAPDYWEIGGEEVVGTEMYVKSDLYQCEFSGVWTKVNPLRTFNLNKIVEDGSLDEFIGNVYNGFYGDFENIYLQWRDSGQGETSQRLYHVRNVQGEIWFSSSDATNSTDGIPLSHYYIPFNPGERNVNHYSTLNVGVPDMSMSFYAGVQPNGSLAGCDLTYFQDPNLIYRRCVHTFQDPSNPDTEKVSLGTIKWWNKYITEVDGEQRWYYTFAADVPVNNTIYSGVWGFYDNDHIETLSWTSGATYESQNYPPYTGSTS